MILEAIGNAIPIAVGIAISPLAVAALMIMLLTARAKVNAPAFLVGWMLGFLIVGVLAYFIPGIEITPDEPTTPAAIVRIALGSVLLLLAIRQWRRATSNQEAETPRYLARVNEMGVAHCILTGFLLSAVHPKNLPLIAAGVAAISRYGLDTKSEIIAFLVFTVIASATIFLPITAYFLAKRRAETLFARWKNWLIRNNDIVVLLLLLIFGTLLIGRGMTMLAA